MNAASIDVGEAWARLEAWFGKRHPELSLALRPGAKAKELAAAEQALGVKLPADFRASVLVHDGQLDHPQVQLFPFAQRLGSLASLVRCWKDDRALYDAKEMALRLDWLDEGKRVRQVHLHPKHIPFAGSPYWDYGRLLFDFLPGPEGTRGQVIARHDIDFVFVCPSFGVLLEKTAQGLEDGTIVVTKAEYASELSYRSKRKKRLKPAEYFA